MSRKTNKIKRALWYLFTGMLLTGTLQAVPSGTIAEAARADEHEYTCPHVGYDEYIQKDDWYDMTGDHDYDIDDLRRYLGYKRTLGTGTKTVFVGPDDLRSRFNNIVPSVGDTFSKSKFYDKEFEKYDFIPYVAKCSLCGAEVYDVFPRVSCYEITFSYSSATETYTVTKVVDVTREEVEDVDCVLKSDIETKPHTYTVRHDCEGYPYNQCKERLHEHKVSYDETIYEYECTCTETNVATWSGEVSSSKSDCGHTVTYVEKDFYCRQCGCHLYSYYRNGCSRTSCWNYYKSDSRYEDESHPGTHKYKAAGIRYECNSTAVYKDGEWYSGNYDREIYCDYCGYLMGNEEEYSGTYGGIPYDYDFDVTEHKHYYYLKPVLEESCYEIEYENLHTATKFDKETYDGESYWSCRTCGESYYMKESDGDYHDDMSFERNFCLADIEYDYYTSEAEADRGESEINYDALHCKRILTCTTAEYGEEYICDRVVTELIPLEESQTILAGEAINTKAYAKFMNGRIALVECALTYDPTIYNETQTATLSYGGYSSTTDRSPRTATISLYIERSEADLTLQVSPAGAGNTTGTGTYTIGTDVSISADAATGYDFDSWYKGNTKVCDTTDYTFTMPAESTILTAKFQPKVYPLNISSESPSMGEVSEITEAAYHSSVTVEATPKTGFVFAGWYDGVNLVSTDATYTFTMPYHPYSLMARFTSTEYTISFDSNGGSACTPVKVAYLGVYGTLPIPTKSGYLFAGWIYNGEEIKSTTIMKVKQNHTLTATWEIMGPEFILVSYGDSYGKNSWSEDSANIGQLGLTAARLNNWLPVPTKPRPYPGYDFVGWYRTENTKGNGDDLGDSANLVTKDTVMETAEQHELYAGWKAITSTLKFDSNGGSSCRDMQITYDKTYNYHGDLPVPTKAGYTFAGWYLDELEEENNGYGIQIQPSDRVEFYAREAAERVLTVYAKWTQEAVNLKVTFDARTKGQIGLTPEESLQAGYGSTTGSITSGDATRELTYPGTYGNYDIIWDRSEKEHPEADGWKAYGGQYYLIDYTSTPLAFPTVERTGYTFDKWVYYDTSKTPATEVTINLETATQLPANHTVYATYQPKEYKITLDGSGATSTNHTKSVVMTFDKDCPSIIIPQKNGYTFQGYFAGIYGTGNQYYDENGNSVALWTEENVTTLYACWQPKDVTPPPTEDTYDEPNEEPEESIRGSVGCADSKGLLYADDYNPATGALTDLQPYVTYDIYDLDGVRLSEGVIPGTEEVAFRARMGSWRLDYEFTKATGKDEVCIYVTVPYRTQYETEDEELVISELQTKTYPVSVWKTWSYWEIEDCDMYYPQSVTVENEAIAGGKFTVQVNRTGSDAVATPDYVVEKLGDKAAHVLWPEYETYEKDGIEVQRPVLHITLEPEEEIYLISYKPNTPPEVDSYLSVLAKNAAYADRQEAQVQSDYFSFEGETLLSKEPLSKNGATPTESPRLREYANDPNKISLTDYTQTYLSGIELDETKANDRYPTKATITYASNVGTSEEKKLNVELKDINGLNIHTPVACEGVITDGVETESGENVLVLKDALNFFTLRVDNTGIHRLTLGYGAKLEAGVNDFRSALSGKSNIATTVDENGNTVSLNQVQFPFDVYVDIGNDTRNADGTWDTTGDDFVEAGTWLTVRKGVQRFYIPVTQKNGTYEIKVRTVAVNCPKDVTGEYQIPWLTQREVNVNPTGYVAVDSVVLDVKSYLKDFRIHSSADPEAQARLSSGTQAVTLKKGYTFTYELFSQGEFYGKNSEIKIIPEFVWVSPDETKRLAVQIYKGTKLPEQERKICYAWEDEPVLEGLEYREVILQIWSGIGMLPEEVLCVAVDTKQGYCKNCREVRYFVGAGEECMVCHTVLQDVRPFSLEEYSARQTLTGKEEFLLQNGFLVIRFEILVKSEENVWYRFSDWKATELAEDARAQGWNYVPGDIIRYDLGKSIADDYEIGGSE